MIIKRLKHTDTQMNDAYFGWDIFRCGDYSEIDLSSDIIKNKNKIKMGYTIIFAINTKLIKVFKRLFISI